MPSFTSRLPAFSGSLTDASGFTGAAISKPPDALRQPWPDTVQTSPAWSRARSASDAGMTNAESIRPTAPPNVRSAVGWLNALSKPMVTVLAAFRPNVRSPQEPAAPTPKLPVTSSPVCEASARSTACVLGASVIFGAEVPSWNPLPRVA